MGCRSGAGLCCASVTRASLPHPHFAHASWRAGQGAVRTCLKWSVWTKAGHVESAGQGTPTGTLKVRSIEPIRPAGVAAGRQDVVPEAAITDRHFGPGVEIGAPPRDHDDPTVAIAVGNDCRGRLDDGAAGGALDDRRGRLLFGGCGRNRTGGKHHGKQPAEDGTGKRTHKTRHGPSLSLWPI